MNSDERLEKALTQFASLLQLSPQGGLGAYATNISGAGDTGQHLDSPLGSKSKKTKRDEERLRPHKE